MINPDSCLSINESMDKLQNKYLNNPETVFVSMWAIAHIGHFLRKGDALDPFVWILLLISVLLVFKPESLKFLLLVAGFQLTYLVKEMPFTDNHLYIMGFVNAGLFLSALKAWWREAGIATCVKEVNLYICAVLLIAYSSAALAKLNSGFFNSEFSCAVTMFYDSFSVLTENDFLPAGAENTLPYIISLTELLIPCMLVFRNTRKIGIVFLIFFHIAISISPTATALDFTITLFALAVLFMDREIVEQFIVLFFSFCRVLKSKLKSSFFLIPVAVFLVLVFIKLLSRVDSISHNIYWFILAPAALLLGVIITWSIYRNGILKKSQSLSEYFTLYKPSYLFLLILLLLNAATPYLGLKTSGTFTMYSNLQTSGGISNHYFINRLPAYMPMDDLVTIIESDHSLLKKLAENNEKITYHELRRVLSSAPKSSIHFMRDGKEFSFAAAYQSEELVTLDPLYHKMLGHRFYHPEKPICRW